MVTGSGSAVDPGALVQDRRNRGASRIHEHVRSIHSTDGAVILDILHGQMFHLNFVGSRILELLKQGSAEPEIVDQLTREFGVDRAMADADVREFLEDLAKHQLTNARAS